MSIKSLQQQMPSRSAGAFVLWMLCSLVSGCSVAKYKNIAYDEKLTGKSLKLDVFTPKQTQGPLPVFIFIHGGNWDMGSKSTYGFLGKNFARKGIVAVNISYSLSPNATYDLMALESATAVNWVRKHISKYKGDSTALFISGHSAGGHLAALISTDTKYFDSLGVKNPLKGTILIDAAGLDMYGYLKEVHHDSSHTYLKTFTKDILKWRDATPLYHLHADMPPFLMYLGSRSYNSIVRSNYKFVENLKRYQPGLQLHVQDKKHIPMITQLIRKRNPVYQEIINFIRTGK